MKLNFKILMLSLFMLTLTVGFESYGINHQSFNQENEVSMEKSINTMDLVIVDIKSIENDCYSHVESGVNVDFSDLSLINFYQSHKSNDYLFSSDLKLIKYSKNFKTNLFNFDIRKKWVLCN